MLKRYQEFWISKLLFMYHIIKISEFIVFLNTLFKKKESNITSLFN